MLALLVLELVKAPCLHTLAVKSYAAGTQENAASSNCRLLISDNTEEDWKCVMQHLFACCRASEIGHEDSY